MKKNKSVVRGITFFFIAFVLYTEIVWAIIESHNSNQQHSVIEFLGYFPSFLKNILTITYLTLFCAIMGIVFSLKWIKRSAGMDRVMAIIILILAILSSLLMLFQLM